MNFYVYIYLRKDGSPYYVGKGFNGRWKASHQVEVPPPDRVIFPVTQTTEEWTHFMEMEFIDHLGRLNDGTGILENFTDGGEGCSGAIRSEEHKQKIRDTHKGKKLSKEHKQKISKAHKGKKREPFSEEHKQKLSEERKRNNNPFFGKEHSIETKKKMSNVKKGNNNPFFGRTHSEETKRKISKALKRTAVINKNK